MRVAAAATVDLFAIVKSIVIECHVPANKTVINRTEYFRTRLLDSIIIDRFRLYIMIDSIQ